MAIEKIYKSDFYRNDYQKNLLNTASSPACDYMVQQLLGLPMKKIDEILLKQNVPIPDISNIKVHKRSFGDPDRISGNKVYDFGVISSSNLNYLIENQVLSTTFSHSKYEAKWIEDIENRIPKSKNQNGKRHYGIEFNSGIKLVGHLEKLLDLSSTRKTAKKIENSLSILFLFPFLTPLDNEEKEEVIKPRWDIFEGSVDKTTSCENVTLILMAIQMLELNDATNNPTTPKNQKKSDTPVLALCKRTQLNEFFDTEPSVDQKSGLKDHKENKALPSYLGNIVLKEALFMNEDDEEDDEKEEEFELQRILRATSTITNPGCNPHKPVPFRKKVISKRTAFFDKDIRGLSIFLSQFSGIACRLHIPLIPTPSGKKNTSDNWVIGPQRWLAFMSESSAKDGGPDATDSKNPKNGDGNNNGSHDVIDLQQYKASEKKNKMGNSASK